MKGIVILSFHKKPGAFVDREYPKGISKRLGFNDTEQNKVYSLHRMRNMRPNYLFLKEKNILLASFFSGFDSKHFIGRPNQCVTIFLDKENPTIWEDILRRATVDLLPELDKVRGGEIPETGLSSDPKYEPFDLYLRDYFYKLEKGEIEPLPPGEGETGSAEKSTIGTISDINLAERESAKEIRAAPKVGSPQKVDGKPDIDLAIQAATKQMEEMEKNTLRKELQEAIESGNKKDQEIRQLKEQIEQLRASGVQAIEPVDKTDQKLQEALKEKDMELEKWRKKVVELNEVNFINQDQILKLTEMTMMQTQEQQNLMNKLHQMKKELEETKAKLETINSGINQASVEEKTLLIENMKVEIESLKEKNKELFMKQKGYESKISSLNQTIEEKNQKIEGLEIKLSATLKKLTSLKQIEDELTNAKQKIEYLSGELDRARKASENETASNAAQNIIAEAEKTAQKIIEDAKAEANRMFEEVKQKAGKIEASGQQQSQQSADSTMLQIKNLELEDKIEELKKEIIQLKKDNKLQRREIEMLRAGNKPT
jgi:chromosome segregation ATPase